MVWLNTQHINESVPQGTFGGSRCTCNDCAEKRRKELELIPKEPTELEQLRTALAKSKAENAKLKAFEDNMEWLEMKLQTWFLDELQDFVYNISSGTNVMEAINKAKSPPTDKDG